MRTVVALGGNALLRRGEPAEAAIQREHVFEAAPALAALALRDELVITHDLAAAVHGAHAIYTDVWASMGQEQEAIERRRAFRDYQVNDATMGMACPDAIFLHCLPAKRGEEVAASVIDGPQSVVWQQSANRMPTEEALLLALTRGLDETGRRR